MYNLLSNPENVNRLTEKFNNIRGVVKQSQFFSDTDLSIDGDNLVFNKGNNNINLTISIVVNGIEYNVTDKLNWWKEKRGDSWKFGANITIPDNPTGQFIANNLQEIRFKVTSTIQLRKLINGFDYYVETYKKSQFIETERRVRFDFSDILNALNLSDVSIEIGENSVILIYNVTELNFIRGQVISLDPQIVIDDVDSYTSFKNNITTEAYPLSHITTNDSSLILYLPFDVNHTFANISYDYSLANNNVIIINNSIWNSTGLYGGAYRFIPANSSKMDITSFNISGTNGGNFTTVAFWVYSVDAGESNAGYFFDIGTFLSGAYSMQFNGASGGFNIGGGFSGTSGTFRNTTAIGFNKWTHIAIAYNRTSTGDIPFVYVNGLSVPISVIATPTGSAKQFTNGRLRLNSNILTDVREGNQILDEFMMWDRLLSSTEISNIFNNQSYRFKTPASQIFNNISISQDGTLNMINITTNTTYPLGTNISLRILEWNLTGANTATSTYQNITSGDNQVTNFSVATTTYNISLDFMFVPDSFNFFSPVLRDNIVVDSFAIAGVSAVPVNITAVYNGSYPFFNPNGTQVFKHFDIGGEGDYDRVGIQGNFQNFYGSQIKARLWTWDGQSYNDSLHGNTDMNGSVLYYHFDMDTDRGENGTNVVDYSVQSNNGTSSDNVIIEAGKFNNAYYFDIDEQRYIEVNNPRGLNTTDYSIAMWIKVVGNGTSTCSSDTNSIACGDPIISRGQATNNLSMFNVFYNQSDRKIYYTHESSNGTEYSVVSSTQLTNGTWYFVVANYENNTALRIYIDKDLETSFASYPKANNYVVNADIWIATRSQNDSQNLNANGSFNGIIDEVMIFNRTLIQAEITDLYFQGRAIFTYTNYSNLPHENFNNQTNITISKGMSIARLELLYQSNNSYYSPVAFDSINLTTGTAPIAGGGGCTNPLLACQIIDSTCNDMNLYLGGSFDGATTCFNFASNANNITLDGRGYKIGYGSGTTGYGMQIDGSQNITIKNFGLIYERNRTGITTTRRAIYILGSARNILIYNNTLQVNSSGSSSTGALYVSTSSPNRYNITIDSNNIRTYGSSQNGIFLSVFCVNCTIMNNNITATSSGSGIYSYSVSLQVRNNKIKTNTGAAVISRGANANYTNNTIISTTTHGLYIRDGALFNSQSNIYKSSGGNALYIYNTQNHIFRDDNFSNSPSVSSTAVGAIHLYSTGTTKNISFYNAIANSTAIVLRIGASNIKNISFYNSLLNSTSTSNGIGIIHIPTTSPNIYNASIYLINSTLQGANARDLFYGTMVPDLENGHLYLENSTWRANTNFISSNNFTTTVNWYLWGKAENATASAIEGANISIINKTGSIIYSELTGADGFTGRKTLIEYSINTTPSGTVGPGSKTFYTNYTVNATYQGQNLTQSVNLTSSRTITFNFTGAGEAPSDNEYPIFSNYYDSNSSLIGSLDYFNVTITSTNGTVFLDINGANYTASNLTASVYNVTINLTSSGVFAYYWGAWGNGSSKNYNTSALRYYTVNTTGDTCTSPASGLWNLLCSDNCTFNTNQNIPANVSITGTGKITLNANWTFPNKASHIFMPPSCEININKGGGFG